MLSFIEIYETYSKLVYNLCLHYLQNRQDAEEATQDIFVKIHQKIEQFKGASSLKTWIYRVSINHCLDVIKARSRRRSMGFITQFFTSDASVPVATFDHPGVLLEDKEALERLFQIIHTLPEQQKTAIVLRYLEDLPPPEVAEVMGVSTKAVESLLQRGKQHLQKKLDNNEGKSGKTSSNTVINVILMI
ncbi:MAG: RNA polymerase sigma factor [Saprospiraceae bacterium]|nr:RNA polymerase sigma factor [Saprospiraceae bacterium]